MATTRRRAACDVTVAVQSAQAYLVKLIGDAEDILLEEVEEPWRTNVWQITLSYTLAGENSGIARTLGHARRYFKQFKISADGEATGMRMRRFV